MQASIGVDVSLGSLPMTAVLSAANPNRLPTRLMPLEVPQGEQTNHLETPPSSMGTRRLMGELHNPSGLVPEGTLCSPTPRSTSVLSGHTASNRKKPHLQGRFSGRLETKEDEKKLHDECRLLGPLVGGVGKRGEKSRTTLAKIVRAISAGDVRKYCEERESRNQEIEERMKALEVYYQREITLLKQENAALRMKLDIRGEEMVHRQVPSGHYSQEPLVSYGMDATALPYLLPSGTNPSPQVLQSQVSGALHSVPLQPSHAHLSIPSLPHHSMIGGMQGNIIQEQIQATKSMPQDDHQARSQIFNQPREGILADASLKRKRDEFGKDPHIGGGIVAMKPDVLADDPQEIDASGTNEEKSDKLAKHYHMTDLRKNSSSEVVEAHNSQARDASDLKTSEPPPYGGKRIHAPASAPHQVLPPNGGDKRCPQTIGYGNEHAKGSVPYQNPKIGSRLDSGIYQAPVQQRNATSGNGMTQNWIHQTAPLGTHYFVPDPDRFYQHISKEPLPQHNNVLLGHAHGVQHSSTPGVHDTSTNVAHPLGADNHAPRALDAQNGSDIQMNHGVMSLLHGRRQVAGSHATMSPPRTGISSESGHQV